MQGVAAIGQQQVQNGRANRRGWFVHLAERVQSLKREQVPGPKLVAGRDDVPAIRYSKGEAFTQETDPPLELISRIESRWSDLEGGI